MRTLDRLSAETTGALCATRGQTLASLKWKIDQEVKRRQWEGRAHVDERLAYVAAAVGAYWSVQEEKADTWAYQHLGHG